MSGSCLKNPQSSGKLSAKPFSRKGARRAWVVVANVLGCRILPLLLRSGVPKLNETNAILCSDKGKVLRLNFHPLRSRAWVRGGDPLRTSYQHPHTFIQHQYRSSHQHPGLAEEADLSGSSLRAWSSDPAWMSSRGARSPGPR